MIDILKSKLTRLSTILHSQHRASLLEIKFEEELINGLEKTSFSLGLTNSMLKTTFNPQKELKISAPGKERPDSRLRRLRESTNRFAPYHSIKTFKKRNTVGFAEELGKLGQFEPKIEDVAEGPRTERGLEMRSVYSNRKGGGLSVRSRTGSVERVSRGGRSRERGSIGRSEISNEDSRYAVKLVFNDKNFGANLTSCATLNALEPRLKPKTLSRHRQKQHSLDQQNMEKTLEGFIPVNTLTHHSRVPLIRGSAPIESEHLRACPLLESFHKRNSISNHEINKAPKNSAKHTHSKTMSFGNLKKPLPEKEFGKVSQQELKPVEEFSMHEILESLEALNGLGAVEPEPEQCIYSQKNEVQESGKKMEEKPSKLSSQYILPIEKFFAEKDHPSTKSKLSTRFTSLTERLKEKPQPLGNNSTRLGSKYSLTKSKDTLQEALCSLNSRRQSKDLKDSKYSSLTERRKKDTNRVHMGNESDKNEPWKFKTVNTIIKQQINFNIHSNRGNLKANNTLN